MDPYSLALRLRRICSKDDFYDTRSTKLELYLTKRGYKNSRAKSIPRDDTLKENSPEIKKPDTVPFISTYITQPYLTSTKYCARNNPFSIPQTVCMKFLMKHLLYRRSPNLQNPATATRPNHSFGTFRCNSKHGCLTCPHINNEKQTTLLTTLGKCDKSNS